MKWYVPNVGLASLWLEPILSTYQDRLAASIAAGQAPMQSKSLTAVAAINASPSIKLPKLN